ncbi:MAG: NUDIX hydrolase N-terminal domain-containing protein [Anaerolineae bacterium]|nr:NUDIX hydrolase N-terminal domain-containing protein [Anaerolineae bacterium]
MNSTEALYQIADEMRGIANLGRYFTKDPYDQARYAQLLALSARLIGVVEQRDPEEILPHFEDLLYHLTPLSGAEFVAFQEGKLLLIKRHDNGLWAVPGGAVEMGETPAETAVRELWEEVQVRGQVTQFLGLFDSRLWGSRIKLQLLHHLFLGEIVDGTPQPTAEATDVGFFTEYDLPPLSPGHAQRIPIIFQLVRGELPIPYFDSP